jgi:hypothetical protein
VTQFRAHTVTMRDRSRFDGFSIFLIPDHPHPPTHNPLLLPFRVACCLRTPRASAGNMRLPPSPQATCGSRAATTSARCPRPQTSRASSTASSSRRGASRGCWAWGAPRRNTGPRRTPPPSSTTCSPTTPPTAPASPTAGAYIS